MEVTTPWGQARVREYRLNPCHEESVHRNGEQQLRKNKADPISLIVKSDLLLILKRI
jgi:hypothetical protein